MEYSKTHCHFCKKKLVYEGKHYLHCRIDKCYYKYDYRVYSDGTIQFSIHEYIFVVKPDVTMTMQEPAPKPVIIDAVLEITPENYLEQAERIKKLQTFN